LELPLERHLLPEKDELLLNGFFFDLFPPLDLPPSLSFAFVIRDLPLFLCFLNAFKIISTSSFETVTKEKLFKTKMSKKASSSKPDFSQVKVLILSLSKVYFYQQYLHYSSS